MTELYRMGPGIKDAILTIMKYIKSETGSEPTQEELASILKSYFIINEVGNQIKYQLKKGTKKPNGNSIAATGPFLKLNLINGPGQNILAKAGLFQRSIKEAIDSMRQYTQKTIGADPDYDLIATSLKSSFILSEIKNQLDYQRKESGKKEKK